MNKRVIIVFMLALIAGCSGSDFPSAEDSQAYIEQMRSRIDSLDRHIEATAHPQELFKDMELRINTGVLNRMFAALSGNRSDDVRIHFLPTKRLFEEKKSALGFQYTNYIDVDSGDIALNLKTFRIVSADRNRLSVFMEMYGEGKVGVSGKYTAVYASVAPSVRLSLRDTVVFHLKQTKDGMPQLVPEPRTVPLDVTMAVKLLSWEIPYTHTIWLKLRDIVQPVPLPVNLASSIMMPVPNDIGGEYMRMVPATVRIENSASYMKDNWIATQVNVSIEPGE